MTHAAGNSLMTGNIFTSGLVHSFLLRAQGALIRRNTKAHSGRFPFPVEPLPLATPRPGWGSAGEGGPRLGVETGTQPCGSVPKSLQLAICSQLGPASPEQ